MKHIKTDQGWLAISCVEFATCKDGLVILYTSKAKGEYQVAGKFDKQSDGEMYLEELFHDGITSFCHECGINIRLDLDRYFDLNKKLRIDRASRGIYLLCADCYAKKFNDIDFEELRCGICGYEFKAKDNMYRMWDKSGEDRYEYCCRHCFEVRKNDVNLSYRIVRRILI